MKEVFKILGIIVGCFVLAAFIAISIMFGLAAIFGDENDPLLNIQETIVIEATQAPTQTPTQTTQAPTQAPLQEVTVETINTVYSENEMKGDKLFKNKRLILVGEMDRVSEVMGSVSLYLREKGDEYGFNSVCIDFKQKDKMQLAKINEGDIVYVDCVIDGKGWSVDAKGNKIIKIAR
jgi:hypothetical protein